MLRSANFKILYKKKNERDGIANANTSAMHTCTTCPDRADFV
jgi:hypothetical protein